MRKPREPSRILKKFSARLDEVAREKAIDVGKIEIWFQDEARIGQKNKITRRWAKRGTRPSAPRDPLLALGCVDPVHHATDLKFEDPHRQQIFEFLETWYAQHGSKSVKLRDIDPRVRDLIGGSRQKFATFVRNLEGARAGGLVVIITKPQGKWGAAGYAVPPGR